TRFDGSEGLGELFEYRIEAISEDEDIDFDGAIGRNCSLTLKSYGSERIFNGVLVEAQWLGMKGVYYAYRLVLRPWLWMLSRRADCRIFSDKDAKDIIKEVFNRAGFNDFDLRLTENYPKLEYCVQYRETDLAFVSRLMEQHGIYYFFEHSSDKHQLILADSKSSHRPVAGHETTRFIPLAGDDRRDREHIYHWSSERRFRTGKVEFNDYDFKRPGKKLIADAKASERYQKSGLECYDHPGKYTETKVGEKYAKVELEAEQSLDHRRHATGDAASLFPGGLTKLDQHPRGSENAEYLIVRAMHSFVSEFYRTGADVTPGQVYYGNYEFQKSDRAFRSQIVTPKPEVLSTHTAVVVGKDGEEIDTDEYGRIRVAFFWDRDKSFSRWARVLQPWAYKQWGHQFIPRVGMEVIVIYEEGDPDYPLVIGSLYNGDNKHPYKLPDNKTQSGVKSNSSKGGNGYNEYMFEDKKGSELIRMHAQKDYDVTVHHVETRKIGEDGVIGPSRDTTLLTGDDSLKVLTGNQTVTVAMNVNETYGLAQSTTIGATQTITVGAAQMTTVTGPITITSASLITLTCGSSSIVMTPASITITSPTVQILASVNATISGPIKSDTF
ncbi:MAG TPA: type VI secretion system tip protein TssI/VgrG, partial [Bradyrhizobium sp.]|nr:type VI secretion system tip protein TssI/VgrG [Bradyrhizobium sp.]